MASLADRLKRLVPGTGPLASPAFQRLALGLVLLAVIALPLVVQTPPIDLVEGAPAPRTVRAPRTVQFEDEEATRELQKEGGDPDEVVIVVRQAGENIVVEGEIVTADDIEIIRRLGLLEQSGSAASFVSLVGLAGLLIAIVAGYIHRCDSHIWNEPRDLLLLATLIAGMVWVTRLALWWRADVPLYALPVPLAAILATLLLSTREGLLVAAVTSLFAVLLGFSGGDTVVATFAWSVAGVVAVSYVTDRRRQLYMGALVVATGMVVAYVATLASGLPHSEALISAGQGAIGGVIAVLLSYGMLPFFEYLFNVTTDVRLLELANPTNSLLRQLVVAAPGTYSHSVMVGNLAEAAAQAIGARPLLARVGAYYHDIGKMRRPEFFVENQLGDGSPHDDMTAHMSAAIITEHVADGLELARIHRLPQEVTDIISQHHGTTLVGYFYHQAMQGDLPVAESDFRYDGVRPQSPEAAVVMLADACEAAVRAIKSRTAEHVESTVRNVVNAKVADAQLDEAEITLAGIETIIQVYSRMLASVYHPRIEYPDSTSRRQGNEHHPDHEPSRS